MTGWYANKSRKRAKMFLSCFRQVEITACRRAYTFAPCVVRKPPFTFCLAFPDASLALPDYWWRGRPRRKQKSKQRFPLCPFCPPTNFVSFLGNAGRTDCLRYPALPGGLWLFSLVNPKRRQSFLFSALKRRFSASNALIKKRFELLFKTGHGFILTNFLAYW